MKKFVVSLLIVFIFIPSVLLGGAYLMLSTQYSNTYMFGIYINDIYVENMTPAQVNEQLVQKLEIGSLMIETKSDKQPEIEMDLSEIGYHYSYLEELIRIQKSDNPILWAGRMLNNGGEFTEYQILPEGTFDSNRLTKFMENHQALKDCSQQNDIRVEIVKTKDGYELIDETLTLLDGEKAKEEITKAIRQGDSVVNLAKKNCYIKKEHDSGMKETIALWKKVSKMQSSEITYVFGDDVEELNGAELYKWIAMDENGDFYVNEDGNLEYDPECINAYVQGLADKYDTIGKKRQFQATSGRMIQIKNSNYGNEINQKAEIAYLTEFAPKGVKEERIPEYTKKAFAQGENDIGDTYIEVDMSNQTMYYYKNGRVLIETPVVTGNTRLGRGTPEKLCYVYYKQRHRVLRGADYATPVSYWIAVNGAIGIHDANWRSQFGGNIYKTNGSHGCINTPTPAVSKLYDLVEVGTPVVIFY